MAGNGFNIDLRPTSDPSYTGSSREPSRQDYKDNSWETLFSGIGNTISGAATAADAEIKSKIQTDVYANVDATRDGQGVGAAVDAQPDPLNINNPGAAARSSAKTETDKAAGDIPPNASSVADRVKTLRAAFDEGKISPTNYYAQLEAESRAIRARFPGYREEVDNMIQKVAGVNPANALVRSIQSDLETQKSTEQTKADADLKYLQQNAKFLDTPTQGKLARGELTGQEVKEAKLKVMTEEAADLGVSRAKSQLDLDASQGKAVGEAAGANAQEAMQLTWNRLFSRQGDIGKFVEQLRGDARSGKQYTPDELQLIKDQFSGLRNNFQLSMNSYMDTTNPESKKSISTMMGFEKAEQFKKTFMGRFEDVEKYITDGNFGAIALNANYSKAMQEGDARQILQKYEPLRNLAAVSQLPGGKEYVQILMQNQNSNLMSDVTKSIGDAMRINRAVKGGEGSSVPDDIKTIKEMGSKGRGAVKSYVEGLVDDLQNPAVPKEVLLKATKAMFSEENSRFLSQFKPEERVNIYARLTSPEVTNRILKEAGKDSDAWRNYSTWAKQSFTSVFKQEGDSIRGVVDRRYMDVKYDSGSNQFQVVPTEEGVRYANKNGGRGNIMSWIEKNVFQSNVQEQVDRMNRGLKMIEPIMKADGYDITQQLGSVIKLAGGQSKNPTMWQSILKAYEDESAAASAKKGARGEATREAQKEAYSFGGSNVNFSPASGGDNSGGDLSVNGTQPKGILGFISKAEGADYDTVYGGKKEPITKMTIDQVITSQDKKASEGAASTVAGAYQFHRNTLRMIKDELGLRGDEVMTAEMQDRLAEHLLEKKGLSQWRSGKISTEHFMNQIAQEWASLPTYRTGLSHYAGDGLNKNTRSKKDVYDFLESLRQS